MDIVQIVRDQILLPVVGAECAIQLLVFSPETLKSNCFSLLISKGLGIGIIAGGSIVKVPQIIKIVRARSADGISIVSYILETLALFITLAYNFRNGNPFSTYGEIAFITIQNVIISILILNYSRSYIRSLMLAAFFGATAFSLFNESIVTVDVLRLLQWGSIFAGSASKIPQIYTNFVTSSIGQLSFITIALQSVGSAARVFTTLREIADQVILFGAVVAASLNAILFLQVLVYPSVKRVEETKKKN